MLLNIILLVVGFVVLIKGADFFVDGASSLATNFKLSKMLIALTIVSFGTSAPEFAVSIQSIMNGSGDIVVGIVAIILGSHFVVNSATYLAKAIGISERIISLTIIAFGTSLPELVTSVIATKKGEYDIAIGNVVGSNIFNIGIVIGIPTVLFGGTGIITFNAVDLIFFFLSAFLLFIFALPKHKITRGHGVVFLIMFIIYYSYLFIG